MPADRNGVGPSARSGDGVDLNARRRGRSGAERPFSGHSHGLRLETQAFDRGPLVGRNGPRDARPGRGKPRPYGVNTSRRAVHETRSRSEDRGYQRISAAAQVNPAPNAAVITSMPGFSRPSATASESATGIDAALLLP